jgi:hypothetical protein
MIQRLKRLAREPLVHFLINDVARAAEPGFDGIIVQIKDEWMVEKITELSERFIDNLIARHEVEVEEIAVLITRPGSRSVLCGKLPLRSV